MRVFFLRLVFLDRCRMPQLSHGSLLPVSVRFLFSYLLVSSQSGQELGI